MRIPGLALLIFASATAVFAAPQTTTPAAQADQQSANANGVDSIIALVKANMSEGLVLKTIQRQNKAYDLTPDDLLKLQKAGVSERIITAMLDPSTASSANPAPAAAPPPAAVPPPSAAPSAAPAAPRAASAPGGSSLVSSGPTGPGAASGAAGSGAAAKGGSASASAAAGCPQASSTAAPAPSQQAPKSGVFSSFKDRLKGSAQKTVDGFGDTMNCAVDKGVQTSESQVSSVANSAAATPGQAVSNATSTATSTATKPVTTATTNANNSVSAAQTTAKKSATSATK
jgi:hypothetical protein